MRHPQAEWMLVSVDRATAVTWRGTGCAGWISLQVSDAPPPPPTPPPPPNAYRRPLAPDPRLHPVRNSNSAPSSRRRNPPPVLASWDGHPAPSRASPPAAPSARTTSPRCVCRANAAASTNRTTPAPCVATSGRRARRATIGGARCRGGGRVRVRCGRRMRCRGRRGRRRWCSSGGEGRVGWGMRCGDSFVRRAGTGGGSRTLAWRCLVRLAGLCTRVQPRRKRGIEPVLGRRSKKPSWRLRWVPLRQIWVEEEEWAAGALISEARW